MNQRSSLSLAALACASILAGCATSSPSSPTSQAARDFPMSQGSRTESCKLTSEQEIAYLFTRWNNSLLTGDPQKVADNYAAKSILLPTVSNKPRLTREEKVDYFEHFLANAPSGKIDLSSIELGCNTAVDAGLYTFTFAKTGAKVSGRYSYTYRWNGKEWLITSHHSSAMPEKVAVAAPAPTAANDPHAAHAAPTEAPAAHAAPAKAAH